MDPSLVRGKKIKKEERYKKSHISPEISQSEEEMHCEKPVMYPHQAVMHSPPLMAMFPQEEILKRKAEILKYQGAYLQFQASILEREAQNKMRVTEERVRMMRDMMGSENDPPHEYTQYSPQPVYKVENEYQQDHVSPVWNRQHEELLSGINYEQPVYPENREETVTHPHRQESPEEPQDAAGAQDDRVPYDGDYDHDLPLDLSLRFAPTSPNLHTQSENMPRIFFSLSGPRR